MIHALILLCSLSVSPQDCNPDNAVDVISVSVDDSVCKQPQQILASLAITAGPDHYWLINCGDTR